MSNAAGQKPQKVENSTQYTFAFDYDASGNLIYSGKSDIGSDKSDAVWQIVKFTYDASNNLTDMQWANGRETFENIWNNRTSLTYL